MKLLDSHKQTPTKKGAEKLEGKVVAAGPATIEAISHLLGLDLQKTYNLRSVAWCDHALEASLPITGEEEVVFRIERRSEDSRGMVLTGNLVMYYRGKDLPRGLVELIERTATQRLEPFSMEELADLVAGDPDLGKPGLAMPPGVDEGEKPDSLLDTWGESDAYADFFARGEISRSQLDSIDHSNFAIFVQHCDAECNHVNPHSIAPIFWLVNYPWEDRLRQNRQPGQVVTNEFVEDQMLTTDLVENDVIMGNQDKVRRILEKAGTLSKKLDKTIFFSNTCVPTVAGEDVESEVKRWSAEAGCPLLFLTVTPRSMVNVFHDILVERRLKAEAAVEPAAANMINLVGFPARKEVKEVTSLLKAAGVEVNVTLLPEINFELIEKLPRGAMNVFLLNETWQHLYDQLLFNTKIPAITPTAPFGIKGTREWMKRVIDELKLDLDFDALWTDLFAPYKDKWEELRAQAGEHRICLITRGDEVYNLTTPGSTWGVPIVAMLEEMGFGLDILLKLESKKQAQKAAQDVYKVFANPKRHTIKGFDSFDMLLSRMEQSPAKAVLTYHFFDWRVTQSGKSPFSLQHFEMGIPGALRTLDRLLGVCRTPFFAKYSKYLKRTQEGLRRQA